MLQTRIDFSSNYLTSGVHWERKNFSAAWLQKLTEDGCYHVIGIEVLKPKLLNATGKFRYYRPSLCVDNNKRIRNNEMIIAKSSSNNRSALLLQKAITHLIKAFPVMVKILLHGWEESLPRSRDRDTKGVLFSSGNKCSITFNCNGVPSIITGMFVHLFLRRAAQRQNQIWRYLFTSLFLYLRILLPD